MDYVHQQQITEAIVRAAGGVVENINFALSYSSLPSVLYRPTLSRDGNQWCALYGENIQEGVCGFGDSPELAMQDFDRAWRKPLETA